MNRGPARKNEIQILRNTIQTGRNLRRKFHNLTLFLRARRESRRTGRAGPCFETRGSASLLNLRRFVARCQSSPSNENTIARHSEYRKILSLFPLNLRGAYQSDDPRRREGYFALATEWRLWLELRSFPRPRMKACFPPN
jgi:hypothetical protein